MESMGPIDMLLDAVRSAVRRVMRVVAIGLNHISGGKLSPNTVTIVGFLAHIPIAWLIYQQQLVVGAILLVVFGLMDTLDGQLAKVQNSASSVGMLLDSTTDRMKEVLLYCGVAAFLVSTGQAWLTVVAIGALGASMSTSYINAWGDVVMSANHLKNHKVNKSLRGGFLPFEVRMFLLVIALLFNQFGLILYVILVLASLTAFERLMRVARRLKDVQN
jgi:CDP-diacylglycerol---glycerol-3-phosphate 3-phosphatidyltransferase